MKWKLGMVYLALLLIASGVTAIYYFAFYEVAWMRYVGPVKAAVSEVAPGDIIPLEVSRVSTAKTTRTFTSSVDFICNTFHRSVSLLGRVGSVDPGSTTVTNWGIRVPTEITDDEFGPPRATPSGVCHVEGIAEIQGTIRPILVPWRSTDFKVAAK